MSVSRELESRKKFSDLQEDFRKLLPYTISDIKQLMESLEKNNDNETLKQLHHSLLRLADAAGTYGANNVSFLARNLDLEFKSLLNKKTFKPYFDDVKGKLHESLLQLSNSAEKWSSLEVVPELIEKVTKNKNKNNLVYTLLGDDIFATELVSNLGKFPYNVQLFHKLSVFESTYEEEKPAVIIVDVDFSDGDISGIEAVAVIKNLSESKIPVIYISNSTEAEFRLQATRAGADRYFCKPVMMNKVIHTVKSLTAKSDDLPYRVLIVDNDVALLECYEAILSESNIAVKTVTEPLKTFSAIEQFKPDVTVVDMYMPDCSGEELVHMIRQDDRWALMPVIFLSAEQDINNQLQAMSLGADDF